MTRRWQDARHVLAVRLDSLGDVLMTEPAMRALRSGREGRRLTLLTSPGAAPVAALLPCVDDTVPFAAPWMKATGPDPARSHTVETVDQLRRLGADAAVIFTAFGQSALPAATLCFLAGIPLRLAHAREKPYSLLTDWVADPEVDGPTRHEVRRQLELVGAIGATVEDERLRVAVTDADADAVDGLLHALGLGAGGPWAVVHPGASASSRRWPAESYAAACEALVARHGWRIVLTGSADERLLVESIRASLGPAGISLAGRLSLGRLAALLARAPVVVTNNTGPAHLAAAVGTPVVDLYALTNPQHTPWRVPRRVLFHDVPCRNCFSSVCPQGHHDCLRLVPPDAVVTAALELAGAALPMAPVALA